MTTSVWNQGQRFLQWPVVAVCRPDGYVQPRSPTMFLPMLPSILFAAAFALSGELNGPTEIQSGWDVPLATHGIGFLSRA